MWRKNFFTLLLLFLFLFSYSPLTSAQSQVNNYRFVTDATIKGIFGSYTLPFYLDEHWLASANSFLELHFNQSDIKQYKYSTMTFYLNDKPIKSIPLHDLKTADNQVKIWLPPDKLLPGFNLLKIKLYHRIWDSECSLVDLNEATWLHLLSSSYLHLEYDEEFTFLKEYPYPYLQKPLNQSFTACLLLPNNPTDKEITAAMLLAADFGRKAQLKDLEIPVHKWNDLTNKDKEKNLVFIGFLKHLPQEILHFFSQEELKRLGSSGIIKQIESPYGQGKKMLIITAQDEKKLLSCIKTLADDSLVKQIRNNFQLVDNYWEKRELQKNKKQITFSDLGYDNLQLNGIFTQQAVYGIRIPKDQKIKGYANVKIKIRYSKAINFSKSSVTAYLNGIPLKSQNLTRENADNDSLIIQIPDEFKDNSYYEVKLVFYLEPKKIDCQLKDDSNIWAFIDNSSYFTFPIQAREQKYLEYYPSPFVEKKFFNDLFFVLSDNPTSEELTIAGNLIAFLGHNVISLADLQVVQSKNLLKKDHNLIVIGTPDRNKIIKKLNEFLFVKFSPSYKKFLSNEKMTLLSEYSKNSSAMQLIKSPWDKEKSILLFTSTNAESLSLAQIFLSKSEYVAKLQGDVVLSDEYGYLQTAYFSKGGQVEKKENIFYNLWGSTNTANLILLGIFFSSAILLTGLAFIFLKKS